MRTKAITCLYIAGFFAMIGSVSYIDRPLGGGFLLVFMIICAVILCIQWSEF